MGAACVPPDARALVSPSRAAARGEERAVGGGARWPGEEERASCAKRGGRASVVWAQACVWYGAKESPPHQAPTIDKM